MNKQEAKADAGKPQLTLVPRAILPAIARVREYGTKKYGDPDNWKQVDKQRYRDAAFRHFLAYYNMQAFLTRSTMSFRWATEAAPA